MFLASSNDVLTHVLLKCLGFVWGFFPPFELYSEVDMLDGENKRKTKHLELDNKYHMKYAVIYITEINQSYRTLAFLEYRLRLQAEGFCKNM